SHPRVELVAAHADLPWQALLTTDRPLSVEGLQFSRAAQDAASAPAGAAHLVYAEPARLRLANCRFLAPRGPALPVCRRTQHLELADCQMVAHAAACCVEVGDSPTPVVTLRGNTVQVTDRRGAALAVWAAEGQTQASVELHLERNTLEAGRIVALAGL